ncbi:TcaA NTF2-like domain-containing protein [Mammaliicoccus lentus]|uniref:TcaA NTF2-like domain-containing protein n=1 Tax=Mammaliicoccus lentus TaxID=42858 RepID=UPI001072D9C9|nr:hypothetical protein [Mammaliicoccus lentus]MBF0795239.1 hypothetical protein [Mammaliicoccus lentus]TFV14635.1 hypothetical protein E4T78_11260 [Mammaliicoccus lentus]
MSNEDIKQSNKNDVNDDELTDEEVALLEEAKRKRRKWIIRIAILVFIIIIGAIIYIYATDKSAKGQIDDFQKSVNNRDYNTLIEMMKTNEQELTKTDMQHFVDYINKDENKSRFDKEIAKMKHNVEDKKTYDVSMGKITDKNGRTIVEAKRDGSRFFFLSKLVFKPNFYPAVISESYNTAHYTYQKDDKSKNVIAEPNRKTDFGKFFVGDYDLDATKSFDESLIDGSVDGQLHINTDKVNKNNEVIVKDDFPQTWFKVKFENNEKLDDNYKLFIDDNEVKYEKDKVYGKFPANMYFNLKAKGRMNDAIIETNEIEVSENEKDKPQELKLTFNQSDIDKELKKEKEIENKAKEFLEAYTDKLNTAYKVSDFRALKRYFEDDESDVAKNIEKQVKSKKETQFTKPKFQSYDRSDNEVTIVLNKKDDDKNNITSKYTLKYDKDKDRFTIKDYTDI